MQINHYNMGRKNGSCHFSNTMDITGEKMMQAFERYQMQTASGVPIKREDINVKANGVIEYKSECDQGSPHNNHFCPPLYYSIDTENFFSFCPAQ